MDELIISGKKYISSKRAAEITGYAKDYVGQLARGGKIEATQVGRAWYVLEDSVLSHKDFQQPPESTQSASLPPRAHTLPRLYSLHQITDIPKTWSRVNYHEDYGPLLPPISSRRDNTIQQAGSDENSQENKVRSDSYKHTKVADTTKKIATSFIDDFSPRKEKMSDVRLPNVRRARLKQEDAPMKQGVKKGARRARSFPMPSSVLTAAGISLLVLISLSGLFISFEVDYTASASSQTAVASIGFDYVQLFLGGTVEVIKTFFQSIFSSFSLYLRTGFDFILTFPSRLDEIVTFFSI